MHSSTLRAIKAALHSTEKTHVIAFLELAGNRSGSSLYYCSRCLMAYGHRVLSQLETLVIGLEEHHVGMAQRCTDNLDQDLVLSRFGNGDFVQMELIVARIISTAFNS
jgi:hypothetical protein